MRELPDPEPREVGTELERRIDEVLTEELSFLRRCQELAAEGVRRVARRRTQLQDDHFSVDRKR